MDMLQNGMCLINIRKVMQKLVPQEVIFHSNKSTLQVIFYVYGLETLFRFLAFVCKDK